MWLEGASNGQIASRCECSRYTLDNGDAGRRAD